jgi:hypothetical protein
MLFINIPSILLNINIMLLNWVDCLDIVYGNIQSFLNCLKINI